MDIGITRPEQCRWLNIKEHIIVSRQATEMTDLIAINCGFYVNDILSSKERVVNTQLINWEVIITENSLSGLSIDLELDILAEVDAGRSGVVDNSSVVDLVLHSAVSCGDTNILVTSVLH